MHISDGVVSLPVLAGGFVVSAALLVPALRNVNDREIPRLAVMTSAFFIASLIHIRMPGMSVHLTFHGLLGVILGVRAPVAIVCGLVLQAMLLGHGGYTVIGVNAALFSLPALCSHGLFQMLVRTRSGWAPAWGGLCGALAVLGSGMLMMAVLLLSQDDSFQELAWFYLALHLPIMVLEGIVTWLTVRFLMRVDSDLLPRRDVPPASAANDSTLPPASTHT